MKMVGLLGANAYIERFHKETDFGEIDREVAGLIAMGYCSWDSSTEKLHPTEMTAPRKALH